MRLLVVYLFIFSSFVSISFLQNQNTVECGGKEFSCDGNNATIFVTIYNNLICGCTCCLSGVCSACSMSAPTIDDCKKISCASNCENDQDCIADCTYNFDTECFYSNIKCMPKNNPDNATIYNNYQPICSKITRTTTTTTIKTTTISNSSNSNKIFFFQFFFVLIIFFFALNCSMRFFVIVKNISINFFIKHKKIYFFQNTLAKD